VVKNLLILCAFAPWRDLLPLFPVGELDLAEEVAEFLLN